MNFAMKSEENVTTPCTSLSENVKTNSKIPVAKFRRSSNLYSSLPSSHSSKSDDATRKDYSFRTEQREAGRSRKRLSSIDNHEANKKGDCIAGGAQSMFTTQSSGSMKDTLRGIHSFGLSNNLSTESIRNACGFYDDEPSDDDLIEVQSTPAFFQKPSSSSSLRRMPFKSNCFNTDVHKRQKISEENSLCALSYRAADEKPDEEINGIETSFSMNLNPRGGHLDDDAAICVLRELDGILDVQEELWLDLKPNHSLETKVEDCLLDLDNYLEEMDDCSVTNGDKVDTQNPSPIKNLQQHRRNRSLSMSRDKVPQASTNNDAYGTHSNEFSHGLSFRRTIGSAKEGKDDNQTSQNYRERRTAPLIFPDDSCSGECKQQAGTASASTHNEIENQETIFIPTTESANIHGNESCESNNTIDNMEQTSRLFLNSELRRCFSHNDFSAQYSRSNNPNEMLTQDNIFQNILQNESNNEVVGVRPRQFGRRAEGHPRILSIRSDMVGCRNNSCTIVNHDQRPMSAPAVASRQHQANGDVASALPCRHSALYIGSEASSVRSSGNHSPISIVSSTASSSTAASVNERNIATNLVANENTTSANTRFDPENAQSSASIGPNGEWPHSFSRSLSLLCCTLGLFNICRFAVLTVNYGGNFLLQFLLLSIIFGIPMFWLHLCLGSKIRSGPVSMWKISPICKGIGITLVLVQCFIAIYSTVAIAWLLVYLRDSFLNQFQTKYRWQEPTYLYKHHSNSTNNLTEYVGDYFNVVVLQRLQLMHRRSDAGASNIRFRVSDRLAFNLAILWAAVFLILCKGLKYYGKVVVGLTILPLTMLVVVTCKLLYVASPSKLQNVFTASDFDDFLINAKTWTAAAQEAFLTWGLLGTSVISMASRGHTSENTCKTALRRDAIIVVLITLLGLSMAALMGLCCIQILSQHNYVYVPGSFEQAESYAAVYSLNGSISPNILSFPAKLVPHHSSFLGETYSRPVTISHRESGYQALRFISELFPAAIALSNDTVFWVWTAMSFGMFILFGLAQLCAMWKPISSALGNSTSSVLLSCVTGLLLSIPFTTEVGISILHYMDLLLGGSWFIPILWTAQIFGVFLIRGRPYNGDDLVNDLKMSASMSAFMALSWNVFLPIGLITLAIIDYKTSLSNQFYYWRGKSYFSYWARKIAGLTQIGILLLVPVTAIVQIYRYLSNGPPDILDRIQLLYRPTESSMGQGRGRGGIARNRDENNERRQRNSTTNSIPDFNTHHTRDDAPPKYTPPPSYTTATGARLAKLFRQSIRRSVRRILGDAGRTRSILPIDAESVQQQAFPPDYSIVHTNPIPSADDFVDYSNNIVSECIGISQRATNTNAPRSLSLGRKIFSQKQQAHAMDMQQRPQSASRVLERNLNSQRPYTAEDVVTVLRTSTRQHQHQHRNATSSRNLHDLLPQNDVSFRSIENLILNAEPLGQSRAVGTTSSSSAEVEDSINEEDSISVI